MCKDGRRVHVTVSLSPVKDERGKITGSSVVAHDITRRKQAEEKNCPSCQLSGIESSHGL